MSSKYRTEVRGTCFTTHKGLLSSMVMCALYKSGFSNILEEAFKFLWVKNEFMVKHIDYIFKMFG